MSRRLTALACVPLACASLLTASPALAADNCPSSHICGSNPQGVVDTLQALGYQASLGKSEGTGNPRITGSASGYSFDIYFYGCEKGAQCSSLGFMSSFRKDPINSAAMANEWNREKRFSAMSYDPGDGSITLSYDISLVGGVNQVNFADTMSWWDAMLGQARGFFDERRNLAKGVRK